MKVQPTHYKGIEFVSFQELPADQQLLLQHNTELERIQILIDGKVCRNCIQYKDYNNWYTSIFLKSLPVQEQIKRSVKRSEVVMEA
jgi:hypothetical protein